MKGGQLLGGIAIGAAIGIGIGYLLGVDSEKKNQWLKMIGSKVWGCSCEEGECCNCETSPKAETAGE